MEKITLLPKETEMLRGISAQREKLLAAAETAMDKIRLVATVVIIRAGGSLEDGYNLNAENTALELTPKA